MGLFDGVEKIVKGHQDAIVQSISVLGGVEETVLVPYEMDAFGYRRCPHLADDLIETDGPHMVKIVASNDFWGKLYHFILEPIGARAGQPDVLHVIVYEFSDGGVPGSQHAWCCF